MYRVTIKPVDHKTYTETQFTVENAFDVTIEGGFIRAVDDMGVHYALNVTHYRSVCMRPIGE